MKIKAGEKVYEVGELTLGEFRLLKREFGVADVSKINPADPDVIVGLTALAALRSEPGRDLDEIVREIEALTTIEVEGDEDETDPTSEGSAESSSDTSPSGGDVAPEAVTS